MSANAQARLHVYVCKKKWEVVFCACFIISPILFVFVGRQNTVQVTLCLCIHTDLREEVHRLQARLRHVELKRSIEEAVAKAYMQYTRSHMTVSEKRRKLKKRLKTAYGYGRDGKTDRNSRSSDEIFTYLCWWQQAC